MNTPTNRPSGSFPNPALAEKLQSHVDRRRIAGAVTLVADGNGVLDLQAVGHADLAARRPMTPETLFWIASTSKPFAATALMMLVDEGKVDVDDPVEAYLPEFHGQKLADAEGKLSSRAPAHPIRVREILSHTSGLPFATEIEKPTFDLLPLRDAVASYAATPLLSEPGTHYRYSNAGINTAGRIVEVLGGVPYEEFLAERLFGPLGMTDTTFTPDEEQISRLAKAYKPLQDGPDLEEVPIGQVKYPLADPERYPFPGGGLFSTAGDLARFGRMILHRGTFQGKHYLSEASVRKMTTKQTGPSIDENYGFGWGISADGCGHGGAYKNSFNIDWKLGLVTLFLVHCAGDWIDQEGRDILPSFQEEAAKLAAPGVRRGSASFSAAGSEYR